MIPVRYYVSIFLRRLHWFILVAGVISGLAVTAAITIPPAYVSQARLILESSQIPGELAQSTVRMPAEEQLQLFETRLLTRVNLLNIANQFSVLRDQGEMNADQIVSAMRSRTRIRRSAGRNEATIMTISFEARTGAIAAAVLNEYLTLIQQEDSQNRTDTGANTKDFFQQEVDRLSADLDTQSARILTFKNENSDALPESQEYRRSRQSTLTERVAQTAREISVLQEQRTRLVQIFEATGRIGGPEEVRRTPDEIELEKTERELSNALLVYSETNPRVKILQAKIAQLEQAILDATSAAVAEGADEDAPEDPAASMLSLQLGEIDSRIAALEEQNAGVEAELERLGDSIGRTPANAIALEALERDYRNVQGQYNAAVDRLATASTGERIELLGRGQRVTVVEQPAVPSEPTRPNRLRIAGGGVLLGVGAGLGLIALLEFLNGTARRSVDLVSRLGVTPIATIPYLRTRRERIWRAASLVSVVLALGVAIPVGIWALHTYYQPLDLLAERIMNKLGVRG